MPVTRRLTIETVNVDDEGEVTALEQQALEAGMTRVRARIAELRVRGLIDDNGKLLITELPDDMKEGSERNFGG